MMGFVTHRMIEQGKDDDDAMMDDDIMASVLVGSASVPVTRHPGP